MTYITLTRPAQFVINDLVARGKAENVVVRIISLF